MDPRLADHRDRARAQREHIGTLLDEIEEDVLTRRPAAGRWCATEHLTHMALSTDAFVEQLSDAVTRARERGLTAQDAGREGLIGRMVVRSMLPPVTRRLKTGKRLRPTDPVSPPEAAEAAQRSLDAYLETLASGDGFDLGRVFVRLPGVPLLRVRANQGFELVVAHIDRHLWLIGETFAALEVEPPAVTGFQPAA